MVWSQHSRGSVPVGPKEKRNACASSDCMLVAPKTLCASERVTRGMEGASRLATKYGKYCYLMAIDTEEFVYSFTEATPAPTDAVYFAKVRELHEASVAIGECSLKCELFKLVRVDTSEATKVRASWFEGGFE